MKYLGKDELELVSKKLTFSPDYSRFRSVCKSWRSAAPKRPQLPWLFTRDRIGSYTKTAFVNFYQFCFENNKFLQIPELSELSLSSLPSSSSSKVDSIGYSHDWLALFNRSTLSVSLFNPLTNSSIRLPVLENLRANDSDSEEGYNDDGPSINLYLTSDPSESDCFALVYHIYSQIILYCKVGCTDWIEMDHPGLTSFHVCCYHGKTFIASEEDVFVCDFGLSGGNPVIQRIVSYSIEVVLQIDLSQIMDSYLVESDGDLLLVFRFFEYSGEFYYKVFKLEFDKEMAKVVQLKSLGDKALFLSPWTTFSLTASKYPGCKYNSIYCTHACGFDDEARDHGLDRGRAIQKLSIYDLEKENDVIIYDKVVPLYVHWGHCGWFTPSLLN